MDRHVNRSYLGLLSDFHDLSSEEAHAAHRSVNPDDKQAVQDFLREFLIPRIEYLDKRYPAMLERIKDTLRYYLSTHILSNDNLEDIYYRRDPAFDSPTNVIDYYAWVWEVLFPGESSAMDSQDQYSEDPEP
jgi:hypothetical protein